MKINHSSIEKTCSEVDIFESTLSLNGKNILELGCGDASLTRLIATTGEARNITAMEVDQVQHQKNLQINDLPNVSFVLAGGENIPAEDNSFDCVFMFKSLHHVPLNTMDKALHEVKRVLKVNGLAYISEPIFAGDFNDILKMFHNEESVRKSAFATIKQAVDNKVFSLEKEIFFNSPLTFEGFEQFENKVLGATHTQHNLSDELYAQVKLKFDGYYQHNKGFFIMPNRVDILRKLS